MALNNNNIGMNNMGMNNMNNMINNINNNMQSNVNQTNQPSTFLTITFKYFGDQRFPSGVDFAVQARGDMTIQQLIKNFRTKLSDDNIVIKSYIVNGNLPLDPNSQMTVTQIGINQKSIITATKL